MRINTGKTAFAYTRAGGYRQFLARETRARWGALPDWTVNKNAPALTAWICTSSWVVTCPDCKDQYIAEPTDPIFFCPNCCNAKARGKSRTVAFPTPKKRSDIEMVLLKRVNPSTRNWIPTPEIGRIAYGKFDYYETIQDLVDQNKKAGEW